jgi:hypothetical protein
MALLPDQDRLRAAAQWMRDQVESCGFTRVDLRAAVDATDAWIDGNQASYNSALPAAFRTTASLGQKTLLFCYVAMRRAGRLRAEED